jgi:hypothetical protein
MPGIPVGHAALFAQIDGRAWTGQSYAVQSCTLSGELLLPFGVPCFVPLHKHDTLQSFWRRVLDRRFVAPEVAATLRPAYVLESSLRPQWLDYRWPEPPAPGNETPLQRTRRLRIPASEFEAVDLWSHRLFRLDELGPDGVAEGFCVVFPQSPATGSAKSAAAGLSIRMS